MKPLNPIQMKQAGPVFARAIENLDHLDRRLRVELYKAQQRPGNSFMVGQLEGDLAQLRSEIRALVDILNLHSSTVILLEHAISEATGETLTVTIEGEGFGKLECIYEKGE